MKKTLFGLLVAMTTFSAAQAMDCDYYARNAVDMNERNITCNCGYKGDRWQSNFQNHKNWCLRHSDRTHNYEKKGREKQLDSCRCSY